SPGNRDVHPDMSVECVGGAEHQCEQHRMEMPLELLKARRAKSGDLVAGPSRQNVNQDDGGVEKEKDAGDPAEPQDDAVRRVREPLEKAHYNPRFNRPQNHEALRAASYRAQRLLEIARLAPDRILFA